MPLSSPPYGYMKDPDNPKHWIVDEEAASVVRRVYDLTMQGLGSEQIASKFESEKILTPVDYWKSKGIKKPSNKKTNNPYAWNSATIITMLKTQEYCGDIINFKTYSKSYKNKKRIENDPEDMMIFKEANEPIIERAVFEKIREKRGKIRRKRQLKVDERNMFSGLLVCADCGSNLNFHFNQGNHEITYFNCTGYNRVASRRICASPHYIRTDFLEQVVLGEIRRLTKIATKYESEFAKLIMGNSIKNAEQERHKKEQELKRMQERDKDLDILFEKIYEDNAMGRITDERFAKMSDKYETEQKELTVKIKELQEELKRSEIETVSTEMFMDTVRKYTRARKLTPQMLNELIDKIEVYQAEKIDGKNVQKLKIHYTCIGAIDIPKFDAIPDTEIKVHTRQGVDIFFDSKERVAV